MKAIIYEKYGLSDVLQLKEMKKPIPKDNEVLVKIYATSINDWDWGLLTGIPFMNRLINGLFKPKIKILGCDIAGHVEAVGKNVKKFQPGDDVFRDITGTWGGFAEYVCAGENMLILKPTSMTYIQAAAIPQAAVLAIQGLIDKGHIKQGQKILINGAGGGVGTFAVQLAKVHGVKEVTGVDSTAKLDAMRTMGYDHVIDYTQEDFTQKGQKYDLILDVKTNRSIFHYVRALNTNGIYVTVGGYTKRIIQALVMGPWISIINKKKLRVVFHIQNKDLDYINQLFETGKVFPLIDETYTLNDAPKALQKFAEGRHKGKIVIVMDHNDSQE